MKDRVTQGLLFLIAVALWVLVFRQSTFVESAHAQSGGREYSLQTALKSNVRTLVERLDAGAKNGWRAISISADDTGIYVLQERSR